MSGEVVRQLQVLCQALLLGGAMGLAYDLLRIVRVRLRLPLAGGALDLLFWLGATGALFLWSQGAWDGRVRLYGAVFCLAGGAVYFGTVSPWVRRLGDLAARLAGWIWKILTFPAALALSLLKKIKKLIKNIFLSGTKWYRIGRNTRQLDAAALRRARREGREERQCGSNARDL